MKSKHRFVLDTNLVVSAVLIEKSLARQVFDKSALIGELLVSDTTQDELTQVFLRRKFDRYVNRSKRLGFLANYLQIATSIQVIEHVVACRDPKDDQFLSLAVNGGADYIITGDQDLLALHPLPNIQILAPRTFLDEFR